MVDGFLLEFFHYSPTPKKYSGSKLKALGCFLGYFMAVQFGINKEDLSAVQYLPQLELQPQNEYCMSLFLQMRSPGSSVSLTFGSMNVTLHDQGGWDQAWNLVQLPVKTSPDNKDNTFSIRADSPGPISDQSFIAFDDLAVTEGSCAVISCDFEPSTAPCAWSNEEGQDEVLPWTWTLGPGPNFPSSGPSADHTTSGTEG